MLVQCVKYINILGEETETSLAVEKGVFYDVLAVSCTLSSDTINYYIQASVGDPTPHWADSRQFEIIVPALYSNWIISVEKLGNTYNLSLLPKSWHENEQWFFDAIIGEIDDEDLRAVELFFQERNKIRAENAAHLEANKKLLQ